MASQGPPIQVAVDGDENPTSLSTPLTTAVVLPRAAPALSATSSHPPNIPPLRQSSNPLTRRPQSLRTTSILERQSTGLARQVSFLNRGLEATFYCQVCMENRPESQAFSLRNCKHKFCNSCMNAYIKDAVNKNDVYIRCMYDTTADSDSAASDPVAPATAAGPASGGGAASTASPTAIAVTAQPGDIVVVVSPAEGSTGPAADGTCSRPLAESDIVKALEGQPEMISRYQRFKANADNPNTRQCPYTGCTGQQVGKVTEPRMICVTCGKEYCFSHANAHVGKSCEAFEREQRQEQKLNEAALQKDAKRCPNPKCGILISKSSGCNHMTCPKCKTNFCWLCGQAIEGGTLPTHYAWWNVTGCAGKQMIENDAPPSCCGRVLNFIRVALVFIFLGIPAALFSILSIALCCCCCLPAWLNMRNDDGTRASFCQFFSFITMLWMLIIVGVLLCILSVPVGLIAMVICIICCPCIVCAMAMRDRD